MYSLGMPVSAIRTKIRQEFERHRYVSQLKTADVLLFQSHSEFQVSYFSSFSFLFFSFYLPCLEVAVCGPEEYPNNPPADLMR